MHQEGSPAVPELWKTVLIAAAAIMALGLIISMTLAHYIGGFFRTVEREAREEAERREREDAALAAGEEHRQEN